jgi:ABC-type oligopeptide transport system substrate-binding subunit
MKKFNRPLLMIALVLLSLILAACNAASEKSAEFPVGKFVNTNDQNLAYEFKADNTWSYYLGGLMGAKGTHRVEGNLWIEEGTSECPVEGTYQWTYDGKNLTFTLQGDDGCQPRKEATDGQSFVLTP